MCYKCENCNKEFKKLCNYEKHLKITTMCSTFDKEQLKDEKVTCPYCNKILASTARQKSHVIICKNKPSEIDELKEIIKHMSTKIDKQNEKIDKQNNKIDKQMEELLNKDQTTYTINQTTNQQQNVFNLVPFGQEKFDYITDKEYKKIFRAGCQSMQTFIPLIYCNKNNPENMNVYIGNFNDGSVRVFNGDGWIIEKKEDVLYNMYHSKRDFLELKYEDMYDKLSDNTKYFFEKFKECNEDPETIKIIQHDIKNMLYANRMNVTKKPSTKPSKKRNTKMLKDMTNENQDFDDYIPDEPMF